MTTQEPGPEAHHGFVLLQAALAEAVLDDVQLADRRADRLSELDPAALAVLVRVASDYICRMSLSVGADWTTAKDEGGEPTNIEDHSPAPRIWSRRLMAAWSIKDTNTYNALLNAGINGDRDQREAFARDLFGLLIDQAVTHARRAYDRPHIVVTQLTRSIRRIGLGQEN